MGGGRLARWAWSLGIERDVTRRILRHVDEKMLDEVYCRPRPEELAERVKAFTAEILCWMSSTA